MNKLKRPVFLLLTAGILCATGTAAYFSDFEDIRETRRNSIMLCGQVGSGKSHLSIAIALNMLRSNTRVMYMPYRDIITNIKFKVYNNKI